MGEQFLSEEWIRKVVASIERAKASDEAIKSLSSEMSLSVAYVIKDLSEILKETYGDALTIYVELDKGITKRFNVYRGCADDLKADYTVESTYDVARKVFSGEINPGVAFVNRLVKVKPLAKVYSNPVFTAKSLILFSSLLKYMKEVPTTWI